MLKVGIIGVGAMGTQHFRRLKEAISNVEVVAVSDVNAAHAQSLIEPYESTRFIGDPHALIQAEDVDAIVIASSSPTHEAYCLAALALQKPVFCEKPLSVSSEGAKKVVDAEIQGGKKLIQLGFNRRFDPAFQQLKQIMASGEMGAPLIAHCSHRAAEIQDWYSTTMAVTETAVHEIDIMSWLMDDYFVSAQVILPRETRNSSAILHDPQVVLLRTATGMLVIDEIFVNCQYGYDIQCEIVAENGTARLPDPAKVLLRRQNQSSYQITSDGLAHFEDSYNKEFQAWVNACSSGVFSGGPTAWDGYKVAVVTDACLEAQKTGAIVPISTNLATPDFYR